MMAILVPLFDFKLIKEQKKKQVRERKKEKRKSKKSGENKHKSEKKFGLFRIWNYCVGSIYGSNNVRRPIGDSSRVLVQRN